MKIIGLTGRSGCGKSTVAKYYRELGYPVADADQIARQVLEPGSPCIALLVDAFGTEILDEQGAIKRRVLADKAFSQPNGSQKLVEITHAEIIKRLLQLAEQAEQQGCYWFFVDGAVIVGAPFQAYCDAILLVTAPLQASIQRICMRDGISEESAKLRLAAQCSEEQLRAVCLAEIRNDSTVQVLLQRAEEALNLLKGGME